MENNTENKARFFALYWGQEVVVLKYHSAKPSVDIHTMPLGEDDAIHLSLRPIESLTSQEITDIGFHVYGHPKPPLMFKLPKLEERKLINTFIDAIDSKEANFGLADYLRSIGILIPFMGLSIQQILDYGWANLKTS